jgi:hypothetical protein
LEDLQSRFETILKLCKYFGLLTSIEIRKGEEGFIKPSKLIAKTK